MNISTLILILSLQFATMPKNVVRFFQLKQKSFITTFQTLQKQQEQTKKSTNSSDKSGSKLKNTANNYYKIIGNEFNKIKRKFLKYLLTFDFDNTSIDGIQKVNVIDWLMKEAY